VVRKAEAASVQPQNEPNDQIAVSACRLVRRRLGSFGYLVEFGHLVPS
jgi:hypothetical protein